jgi:hypothetical protein
MSPDLWSVFLAMTVPIVKDELRRQGHKPAAYTNAEIKQLAHQRLVQECREWLARNG